MQTCNKFTEELLHSISHGQLTGYLALLPEYEQLDPLFKRAGLRNVYHERMSDIISQFDAVKRELTAYAVDLREVEICAVKFIPRHDHALDYYHLLLLGKTGMHRVELEIPVVIRLDDGQLYPFAPVIINISCTQVAPVDV